MVKRSGDYLKYSLFIPESLDGGAMSEDLVEKLRIVDDDDFWALALEAAMTGGEEVVQELIRTAQGGTYTPGRRRWRPWAPFRRGREPGIYEHSLQRQIMALGAMGVTRNEEALGYLRTISEAKIGGYTDATGRRVTTVEYPNATGELRQAMEVDMAMVFLGREDEMSHQEKKKAYDDFHAVHRVIHRSMEKLRKSLNKEDTT